MTAPLIIPGLDRVRKHHAIEHATIAVLLQRQRRTFTVLGRSDPSGFQLFSPFGPEEVEPAITEAMDRLRAGEAHLAVTNNCGTNIVATGILAGVAAVVGAGSGRERNWPRAIVAAMFGVILAAPIGRWVQRHATTDPDIAGIEFEGIREFPRRGPLRHLKVTFRT